MEWGLVFRTEGTGHQETGSILGYTKHCDQWLQQVPRRQDLSSIPATDSMILRKLLNLLLP